MRYIFIIILAGVLSSFGKHGESGNANVHNWIIYYNDSVLLDTRKHGHAAGFAAFSEAQVKSTDSLKITYYNDRIGCNVPLIIIKSKNQATLNYYKEKLSIPLGDLVKLKANKNISEFEFHYIEKCDEDSAWRENLTRSLLDIKLAE